MPLARIRQMMRSSRVETVEVVELPDLSWVDTWIRNVRDYIHVREEDNVFIKRPNTAFHLNPQGVAIVKRLLDGASIAEVLAPYGKDPRVWGDVDQFLRDLKMMLQHGIDDTYESAAVEKKPFEMEFSDYPVLSEVAITYRCNAKCQFCYAGCNCTVNPIGNDHEMTLAEVKGVLRKIKQDAKVPSVSFTGGEATLRPDLPEMIAFARSLGMRVNLITNGLLSTQDMVDRLVAAGLHSVQVSIEGASAATHDAIVQIPGSFSRSVAAVHRYLAAGVNVNTNTTINKLNLSEALTYAEFAKRDLKLDAFSMNLMIPTGTGALDDKLLVRYRDIGPVLEEIIACSQREGIEFKWYSPTPMCIFNPIVHGLGNKGCSACDGLVSVGADGQVLPCASYDEPVGSLLDSSFEKIWRGKRATDYRKKAQAHDICKACENFHICNGACPLYWRKTGYGELLAAQGMTSLEVQS